MVTRKPTPPPKDREKTEQRLLAAVGRLLEREGFRALGVNAIAREAGVDKVLLYRYFGDLDGLLRAFARSTDYWPVFNTPRSLQATAAEPAAFAAEMLITLARELRERPATQEALRWELVERNELAEVTHDELREVQGRQWLDWVQRHTSADVPALASVIAGGLSFLVLRAKTAGRFNGLDLNSEADWRRIEAAVTDLVTGYLAVRPAPPHDAEKEP